MKRLSGALIVAATALIATIVATSISAKADGPIDEQTFIDRAGSLGMFVLPRGRYSTPQDILAGGYRARAIEDQHPNDPMAATRAYYPEGNTVDGRILDNGYDFMRYAALYLCLRNMPMFARE
jgi:hypothetical protein